MPLILFVEDGNERSCIEQDITRGQHRSIAPIVVPDHGGQLIPLYRRLVEPDRTNQRRHSFPRLARRCGWRCQIGQQSLSHYLRLGNATLARDAAKRA
jgi:hypothetical protein